MPVDIGPRIGIDGEKEFKQAIASINTNLKTMGAEMDMVTSQFIGNEKSVESLTAQNEVLTKRMEELNQKADLQKQRLQELDKAGVDPTSKQYQTLQASLYKTEAEMNKTQAAMDSNTKAMNGLGKEAKNTEKATSTFGEVLKANLASKAIESAIKGVAKAAGDFFSAVANAPVEALKAFGGALVDCTKAIADQTIAAAANADELKTMSDTTGLSVEQLQEYQYASGLMDVSVETITGSLTKLTNQMDSARDGSSGAAAAFEALGISVTNQDGTLRSSQEVFAEAIDALGQISNETERDALAMDLFGKSAQELNPLINAGSEGLAALTAEAHAAGAVMSEETVNALGAVDDAMVRYNNTLGALKNSIAAEFAEPMEAALTGVTQILQGNVDEGLDTIMTAIESATEIIGDLIPELQGIIEKILGALMEHLPELLEAGVNLIMTIVTGIVQALPELIPKMVDLILLMADTLLAPDNIKLIVEAGVELIIQLAIGLAKAIPQLVTAILGALDTIVETLWEHKDDLMDAGKDLITGLWEGIQATFTWLWDKVTGFAGSVVDAVKGAFGIQSPSKVFADQIGKNLALGIGVGFEDTMGQVENDMMAAIPVPSVSGIEMGDASIVPGSAVGGVEEIVVPVTVDGVELARVLYRHIVGEGQRIGTAAVV